MIWTRLDARIPRLAAAAAMLLLLAACGAAGPLMPEQRPTGSSRSSDSRPPPAPEAYRVRRGDTLYSIAFRYGMDWRTVARWNGITAPYTIHLGDWIRLQPQPDMRPAVVTASRPETETGPGPAPDTRPEPRPRPPESRSETTAAESASEPSPDNNPVQPSPRPQPAADTSAASRPAPPSAPVRNAGGVAWRWPTEGRVARGFNSGASRKGILIAGENGQPVRAAADGEVVYSGNGLIGYGELIIIKHSDRMLSAYAHNRERLVGEGDSVRSGQEIARMGSNERDEQVLHFEIRQDGKPTDPANFLPSR